MPLKKDDPDELLQFDAALVAIRAGTNAEMLAKLQRFAKEVNRYASGVVEYNGVASVPAKSEEDKGGKLEACKDDPDELLQFDTAFVAIRAGTNAEMLAKLQRFANQLNRYVSAASSMMEHNGVASVPAESKEEKQDEDKKPEANAVKSEESDGNVVKGEELQPQRTPSAPEADVAVSTVVASDGERKLQAKEADHKGDSHQKEEALKDVKTSPSDNTGDAGQRKRKRDESSSNGEELNEVKKEATLTGNDSDDTSVEDVSDKIAADREAARKARAQDDVISIHDSSDEDESLLESEDDESLGSEDDDSEDDDSEYEDDSDESGDEKERKAGKKKPILPLLHVKMNPRDVPVAPGCDEARLRENSDSYSLMDAEPSFLPTASKDERVKARVIKLLNTGFHQGSNENEAKAAIRLAQKLMQRHNLSQVLLMKERDIADKNGSKPESLKGGMAKVHILNAKSQKASPFYHWIRILAHALAAYAFKVATERVSVMMQEYSRTVKLRTTYARGIARGLDQEVEETQKQEEEKRKAKLEKARLSVKNGEAYEESDGDSDDDDDDDSQEGAGFTFAESTTTPAATSNESAEAPAFASSTSTGSNAPVAKPKDATMDDKESASQRLERLEKREEAALALVDHHEQVAKDVLKEKNIKLRSARKITGVDTKSKAYEDGLKDSRQLDINQRAIRNGVKKEKV